MKVTNLIVVASACLFMVSCGARAGRSNNAENHEGHVHSAACSDSHEGHNHDTHEGHNHDAHEHEGKAGVLEQKVAGEIVFSPEQAAAAGVKTEKAVPQDFQGSIRTSGRILPAKGSEVTVAASSAGIVSFGGATPTEGKSVSAGEVIATVSASKMADGDPVTKAKIAYMAAEKEYRRAEGLVADRIISQREFDRIKADYDTAKAAYEGVSNNSGADGVTAVSPIKGYIKSILVGEGDYVGVGEPIAVITQDSRLQLVADMAEKYIDSRQSIASANFRLPYSTETFSLQEMNGRLLSVGKSVADGSPYLPVTFEFNNVGNITAGSYAEVWLLTARKPHVISVPMSALTEEQGLHYIYIRLDEECYRKQHVTLGIDNGRRVEILGGLNGGEEVVTEGAYHIKLAAVSTVIPEGHNHNH